ncbi:MAG: TRAP transporter large permease subunit [Nitrospira sp.]|nr:TRAP transporter large permease subunit [Nitrospira sp.]
MTSRGMVRPDRLSPVTHFCRWGENSLAGLALILMAVLPVVEILLRLLANTGIPASASYVQSLSLWVGFIGAMLAARDDGHLTFLLGREVAPRVIRTYSAAFTALISTAVAASLSWASFEFVRADLSSPIVIGDWLPTWVAEVILPFSFAVMAVRFAMKPEMIRDRFVALLGVPAAAGIGWLLPAGAPEVLWAGLFALLLAAILGTPIFIVLGGVTLLLLRMEGTTAAAIPVETYRLVVSPSIPAIPLFTLAGYVLAEGGASRRLVRLFRAWFGWLPGGLAVVVTLLCAFLTTFTGASGVTILAVGGLLLPVLLDNGYRKGFAIGLLTSTGSIGLLFPPSLAVILYGVVAHVSILDLFKAGVLPGLLLVTVVSALGIREVWRNPESRTPFAMREALTVLWEAKWELMIPLLVLGSVFGGYGTLIETAAMTAVYTLVVEVLIHRELDLRKDVPAVLVKCLTLLGGVFAILGVALGLANYLVDAEVPMKAADWFQRHIESKLVFLMALNLFLIIVGCLLDIFSAITIVVPLIQPISQVFGVEPLHLAMIFLLNMQLGYVTPPVGLDLFFASYRFGVPLGEVFRHTIPFFLAMLIVLLLVTYVPWLALAPV